MLDYSDEKFQIPPSMAPGPHTTLNNVTAVDPKISHECPAVVCPRELQHGHQQYLPKSSTHKKENLLIKVLPVVFTFIIDYWCHYLVQPQ